MCACAWEPVRIRGYRLIDDRTLSVLSEVGTPGYETWLASVAEESTRVIVEARTRQTEYGNIAGGGQDVWLTVVLQTPLLDREVFDAATGFRIFPVP
jgi:hypothetical protein